MAPRPLGFHAVAPREGLDKVVLVAAFVGGAGGIVAMKLAGAPVLLPAIFAAAVLFAYAALAWLIGKITIEPETIGDNCYYLGFLFTLASLSVTLWQLTDPGSDDEVLRSVVAGFGVALSSTVVGVFLRVLLMQVRPDITARDRAARLELHAAAREFRSSLVASTSDIKTFATEAAQLLSETARKVTLATEAQADAELKRTTETAEAHERVLRESLAEVARLVVGEIRSSLKAPLEGFRDDLGATLRDTRELVQAEAEKQRAAHASTAAAAAEQAAAAARAAKAADALAHQLGALDARLAATANEVVASTESTSRRLETALASVDASISAAQPARALTDFEEGMRKPIAGLEAAASSLAALCERLDQTAASSVEEGMRKPIAGLEAAASSLAALCERLDQTAASSVEEGMRKPIAGLEAAASSLAALCERLDQTAASSVALWAEPDPKRHVSQPPKEALAAGRRTTGGFRHWLGFDPAN